MVIPKVLVQFAEVFREAQFDCYLVGGAVRNMLMGALPGDFDITTDARPEQVRRLFRRVIPTGIKHGTVTVIFRDVHFEVTTYRIEGAYSDSRRPDSIEFSPSLEQDLQRRDFTINAIALDPLTRQVVDPSGGRGDIKARRIRAIGSPQDRFAEDGLRLMRACRIAAQLGFAIEAATLDGIRASRQKISAVSAERIRDEIEKIIASPRPSLALDIMKDTHLLVEVLPELAACAGLSQMGKDGLDVYEHSLLACNCAPADNAPVRLAALFHDLGKPVTMSSLADGEVVFYGHEVASEAMAGSILRRLRFPGAVEQRVKHLVRNHMFNYDTTWSDAAVRRFLRRVGEDYVEDLLRLRQADVCGAGGRVRLVPGLEDFRDHIERVRTGDLAVSVTDLDIDGDRLAELGVPRGPEMGIVLNYLLEAVLDDPTMNNEEQLRTIGKRFYESRIKDL